MNTTTEKTEDKRDKIKKIRDFHQATFNELGVSDALFIPKMAYRPHGKTEKYIGFFASEVSRGEDIFVEFITGKELVCDDPCHTLYKWRFNPHFEEEYEKTEETNRHFRYLVPVAELVVVKSYDKDGTKPETKKIQTLTIPEDIKDFDLPNPEDDLPMDQMTIRDYAAIHMRMPVSKKEWLNNVIKNCRPW